MNKTRITVIGHYGLSLIFDVSRFPVVGETLCAMNAATEKGGKGFNQAFTASKLGACANFITAVGDDEIGRNCESSLKNMDFGGGSAYVKVVPGTMTACGVALNSSDSGSEVVVFSGAITSMTADDIKKHQEQIISADVLLIQNEAPAVAIEEAANIAGKAGVKIVYNPAPAVNVPTCLYKQAYCITPNETEAAILTGADPTQPIDLSSCFDALHQMGAANVVITLGASGSAVSTSDGKRCIVNPLQVKAVNTTGAGDCFNGALAVALAEGKEIIDAVVFATAASGLSVSNDGICESVPDRDAVERILLEKTITIKNIY